jgi:tetratricopeptide (TPR) repeat protein
VGAIAEALEESLEARRIADGMEAHELGAGVGSGYWLSIAGHTREAVADLDATLAKLGEDYAVGRDTIGFSAVIWSTFYRGILLVDLGHIAAGREAVDRGLGLAREHDDVESSGWAHGCYAQLDYYSGERGDGVAHSRQGLDIAERLGSSFSRSAAYFNFAFALLAREEYAEALAAIEEALQIMQSTRTALQYEAWNLASAAQAQLALGNVDAAIGAASRGVALATTRHVPTQEGRCRLALGRALSADRPTQARAELEHALELVETGSPVIVPHIHEALGELAGMHGRDDARIRQLQIALDLYEQHGATGHARRVSEGLAAATA